MPVYIDADELLAKIENSTSDTWGKGLGRSWWAHSVMLKDNFVKLIKEAPTADVVPRAEVEKAKTKVAPTVSKMEQVRSEVVREIFEEIERHLNPYQIQEDIYTRRAHENGDMRDYQIHQYAEHIISHTLDYFAELKKKYIGE